MPEGLCAEGVTKTYEGREVLRGVQLSLKPGDTVAVVGPSGCGKTTLLNLLGTMDTPDSGRISLGDTDYATLDEAGRTAFRNQNMGFVFQDHLLLPELTCIQNVLVPVLGRCQPGHLKRAVELLETLGIGHRKEAYPWQMSGGERQRAALARALLLEPRLLLCDEPTGNLDENTGCDVMDLLMECASSMRVMMVLATHNLAQARRCSVLYRFENGLLVQGSP